MVDQKKHQMFEESAEKKWELNHLHALAMKMSSVSGAIFNVRQVKLVLKFAPNNAFERVLSAVQMFTYRKSEESTERNQKSFC